MSGERADNPKALYTLLNNFVNTSGCIGLDPYSRRVVRGWARLTPRHDLASPLFPRVPARQHGGTGPGPCPPDSPVTTALRRVRMRQDVAPPRTHTGRVASLPPITRRLHLELPTARDRREEDVAPCHAPSATRFPPCR